MAVLAIALLALAAPVGAMEITIDPGADAIKNAITTVEASADSSNTITLNHGTYSEHGLTVTKSLTIKAADGHGPLDTIISGTGAAPRIFTVTGASTSLTIDNLTLQNGKAADGAYGNPAGTPGSNGGAISSDGPVIITSSTITGCSAGMGGNSDRGGGGSGGSGGAVYSTGAVTVTSSTITGCSAGIGGNNNSGSGGSGSGGSGGAVYATGAVTVTSSTITGCSAGMGGSGAGSTGSSGTGGAVYGSTGSTVRFCRLSGNDAVGVAVYGSIDATDNWWGSNGDPSSHLGGGATFGSWLVLGITADPAVILLSQTSAVRANLTFNSTDSDTSADGLVPDGIAVAFAHTSGTGSISPGQGNVISGANTTTFTPVSFGTDTVTATVDSETVPVDIVVLPPPVAGFTATPLSGNAPLTVTFTDITDVKGGTMWNWSFGDSAWENTTASSGPVHTYTSSGIYTVALTVTNATGSDTETKAYYITATKDQLVAGFTGSPLAGTAPLTVQFTDISTGPVYSWIWNFGSYNATDNGISSLQNPSHTYDTAGTYTITLTVNNTDGSSTLSRAGYVTVTAPGTGPVVAGFTGTPLTGTAPLVVQFTDTSAGTPDRWAWSFGDGGTSTDRDPSHTYTAAGAYTVTLTATNGLVSDTLSVPGYVTVTSDIMPVVANFANATPRTGTAPLTVQFTDTSAGLPNAWSWSFGDGAASSLRNPSHTYTATGSYTVSLTAVNGTNTSTLTQPGYVTVTTVPVTPVPPPSGSSGTGGTFASSGTSGGSDSGTGPAPAKTENIVLSVDSSYLAEHSIVPADIRIMSYAGGRWSPLDTRFTGSSGNRFFFASDNDRYSLLSIGNTKDGNTGLPAIGGDAPAASPAFRTPATSPSLAARDSRTVSREETTVPAVQQPAAEPPVPQADSSPAGSSGFPFMTPVLMVAGCIGLIGSGWYVRRLWIRRQNPALFREYD